MYLLRGAASTRTLLLMVALPFSGAACADETSTTTGNGGNTKSAHAYPLVTPPVERSTPAAFKTASGSQAQAKTAYGVRRLTDAALDANAFISRFFAPGPTELFNVLGSIDNLIDGINMQAAASSQTCLTQTPVAYELATPGGNVSMYAQCYETQAPMYSGDPAFLQWGMVDGTFYVYSAVGVGWTAAIATPLAGVETDPNATAIDPNSYSIHAWYSVGLNNFTVTSPGIEGTGWFNGSYCIAEISADPSTNHFEMSAAGGGIGFCGAQFVSDGNSVFGIGSADMGSTCNDTASVCLNASTGAAESSCGVDQSMFTLASFGRQTSPLSSTYSFAASTYPGGSANTVVLNGTASDSAHFGPTTPTPGVGEFKSMQASAGKP